ncbi:MAG: sugar transferase [Isosphaeraceae bacterium]
MRVLHLLKTSVGATWALRQVRELVRLGVEVHVALPPGGPLLPAYQEAGATVHAVDVALPIGRIHRWPSVLRTLRGLVSGVRPDLIHSHFVATTLSMRIGLGPGHDVPRIFQVPGPLHLEHPFFRRAEIGLAGPRDSWVASCRWTRDRYLASGIQPERVFLSYYGIDVAAFRSAEAGKLRRAIEAPPGARLVGMVAYFYAPKRYLGHRRGIKGHEDFIDALALCLRRRDDLLGVIIGGPWEGASAYERRVQAYGQRRLGDRIRFLGPRSDVADLYPGLDVAVHPSLSENVGGAVESLAQAVPTVGTAVGGLPDLIIPGRTGWLVPPRDPPRLAEAILEALAEPERAKAMATAGQALATSLLDVRRNAAEILEIYERVLGRDCGRSEARAAEVDPSRRPPPPNGERPATVWTAPPTPRGDGNLRACTSAPSPTLAIGETQVSGSRRAGANHMQRLIKRCLDIALSLAALLLLAPVMAAVAVAIFLEMGRPVFFRQVRPGFRARPFVLIKFRSMRNDADADGRLLPDAQRLTRLGRFLRRTSLDELPQLWNVLKGDMSLVGPRPLLTEYLPLYSPEQRRRHEVRPGMTGLAQVSGRNHAGWDERFRLDVWYVDHWSLWLDLKILCRTVRTTIVGAGAEAGPSGETMSPFRGSVERAT